MFRILIICSFAVASAALFAAEIEVYRWVDEQGVVHYTEQPPPGRESDVLDITAQPAADRASEVTSMQSRSRVEPSETEDADRPRRVGWTTGPLPVNAVSVYLATLATGIDWDVHDQTGRFNLRLGIREGAPGRLVLKASFPNPARPGEAVETTRVTPAAAEEIEILSPPLKGFRCETYLVTVRVFDTADRDRQIGTHYQHIRSSVDLSRIRNSDDFINALFYGNCGPG